MAHLTAIVTVSALLFASTATAQKVEAEKPQEKTAKAAKVTTTDAYPFDNVCVVLNKPIKKKAVIAEANGHSIKVCCKKCKKKVESNQDEFAKKIEEAVISQQSKNYPLSVCAISGEKLGSMGKPVSIVIDNHLVKLCCKGCVKKAQSQKAEIIAKITEAAYKAQANSKAPAKCPVSGEDVGDEPVEIMHGTTLVKLCCKNCKKKFVQEPSKFLAEAAPKKAKESGTGN